MSREPCVYVLASRRHGTIYIGVTSNLMARLQQHRERAVAGFTSDYSVTRLVHVEMFDDMYSAIAREKQLKAWRRAWKIALIEKDNPFWEDLAIELGFAPFRPIRHPGLDPDSMNTDCERSHVRCSWVLTFVRMTQRTCLRRRVSPSSG